MRQLLSWLIFVSDFYRPDLDTVPLELRSTHIARKQGRHEEDVSMPLRPERELRKIGHKLAVVARAHSSKCLSSDIPGLLTHNVEVE